MERRQFVTQSVRAGLAGAAVGPAAAVVEDAPADPRVTYEVRTYELRNDLDPARADAYFAEQLAPALRRLAAGPVGAFAPDFGMPTPARLFVIPHADGAAAAGASERLDADAALSAARQRWERGPGLPYVRYDAALYRAFAGHPRPEPGPARPAGAAARLFELRTYEAPNETGLRHKVAMFDDEEIRIFRAVGMAPVWFGAAVAAPRMPHLAYMLAFDDAAARQAAWARFVAHPDWQRIRVRPGWTDPEAVSNIRAAFLRPTAYSDIR